MNKQNVSAHGAVANFFFKRKVCICGYGKGVHRKLHKLITQHAVCMNTSGMKMMYTSECV